MKEFIYLPVCACMEGKGQGRSIYTVLLCFPATLGLSGYDSCVKSEIF